MPQDNVLPGTAPNQTGHVTTVEYDTFPVLDENGMSFFAAKLRASV